MSVKRLSSQEARPDMTENDPDPIPRPAFWLGTSGLVPFVVLTSALYAMPDAHAPVLMVWLSGYSAVVLSFVGAIHWGVALVHQQMRDPDRTLFMTWSMVPALAAWAALLLPAKTGLLLMAGTFVVQHAADRQLAQRFGLPPWYLKLRAGLTAVVVLCLIMAILRLARG